ncbi:trypsin-like peptidase domain-containing protein [Streptomyces sp. NPDC059909]|uniref:VMAP-C domain-containing protein n=1 Tax=Streptomyces sp. NPDC059909 TaxID=3346998 RepID=UPI003650C680
MAATVRIHGTDPGHAPGGPGGGFLGSGFFVAPSYVLTCAHVAMQGEGREVDIVFESAPGRGETSVRGTVVAALPESRQAAAPEDPYGSYGSQSSYGSYDSHGVRAGGWPAPDLALIQLLRPVEHACVYVSERPGALFAGGSVLYAGWTVADGRPKRLTGRCEVMGTFGGWADADEQIRLDGDWLVPGVSGGPAVDLARGEVVGVLKSRLDSGKGGTSIGVERLRSLPVPTGVITAETDDVYQAVFHAHDRYHADRHTSPVGTDRTWADVQSELRPGSAGRALSPQQRIDLLGRLAEFPPPVSTHSLLGLLSRLPGSRPGDHGPAPRGWRDGLGALYEATSGDGALELVLRYCMGVIAAERPYAAPSALTAEKSLWEWVKRVADDRLTREFRGELTLQWHSHRADHEHHRTPAPEPAGEPAPQDERPFVLLELEPRSWERDRYDWRIGVAHHTGDFRPVAEDSNGTALGALPARIAAPLTEAFRRCDEPGSPAVLQVAMVRALLGLDVENWRVPPDGPPLGAVRPVVVRCSDLEPPPTDAAAAERFARWNRTSSALMRAAVVDCEDGLRVAVPEVAELRALAHETVPVLCRFGAPPAPESTAGLVRVLDGGFGVALWRRGTDAARSDGVCSEFHRRAADTLTEARTAGQLPRRVHELRRGVLAGRTETYWSDGIALLYDDPHHPLPGAGQLLEAP